MYIEFHARSAFSFLEGATLPEDLISACAAHHMPAMALLDRDGVYGSPRFYLAADPVRVKAHSGAEVSCEALQNRSLLGTRVSVLGTRDFRLPLLVTSRTGYQNLCQLI